MAKIWPYIRFSSDEQRKGDSLRRQQNLIDLLSARPEIVAELNSLDLIKVILSHLVARNDGGCAVSSVFICGFILPIRADRYF